MKKERSARFMIIMALLRAAVVLVVFTVLFGVVLYFTDNPMAYVRIASVAILLLSGGVTGFLGARLDGGKMMPQAVAAVIVGVIMIALSVILSKGIRIYAVLGHIAYIAASILLAYFASRGKKRRRR